MGVLYLKCPGGGALRRVMTVVDCAMYASKGSRVHDAVSVKDAAAPAKRSCGFA